MHRGVRFLAAALLGCGFASAQASGLYIIDPAGSGSRNFKSFDECVKSLFVTGVGGPVDVLVQGGTYVESVLVPPITGVSSTNTVTFRPLAGPVTLQGSISNTFTFIGATGFQNGWFVFDNLTFDMAPGFAIFATAAVEGIEVRNCTFNPEHRPTSSSEFRHALIVKDNTNTNEARWILHHNKFTVPSRTNRDSYGIYLQNGAWDFHHNEFDMNGGTTGLYLINNNSGLDRIYDNVFHGSLQNVTAATAWHDQTAAIKANLSNFNNDIAHNTFFLLVPGTVGCAVAVSGCGTNANRLNGNIFFVLGTGHAVVYQTICNPTPFAADGNLYFVPSGNVGRINPDPMAGTSYQTLAQWQAAPLPTPVDANSISGDPQFTSVTGTLNLRPLPTSPVINRAVGTPNYVVDDFEGRVRDAMPDIGAYELNGFGIFGSGCTASGQTNPLTIGSTGGATIPSPNFAITLANGRPNLPASLFVGTSRTVFLGVNLPFPLGGGCDVLVGPVVTLTQTTNASGMATQSLPIPNDPTFVGTTIYFQWVQIDPGAQNPFGVVTSNGGSLNL